MCEEALSKTAYECTGQKIKGVNHVPPHFIPQLLLALVAPPASFHSAGLRLALHSPTHALPTALLSHRTADPSHYRPRIQTRGAYLSDVLRGQTIIDVRSCSNYICFFEVAFAIDHRTWKTGLPFAQPYLMCRQVTTAFALAGLARQLRGLCGALLSG